VKGSQSLQPLFEFSGACDGCGETPYLKLVSQLFATACWWPMQPAARPSTRQPADDAVGHERRRARTGLGNSLFEDNAEFGLGIRLGLEASAGKGPCVYSSRSLER